MSDGTDTVELEETRQQINRGSVTNPTPEDRRFGKTDKQRMVEWIEEMKKPRKRIIYAPDK